MFRIFTALLITLTLAACGGSGGGMPSNSGPSFAQLDNRAERLFDGQASVGVVGERTIKRAGSASYDGVFYGEISGGRNSEFLRAVTEIDVGYDGNRPQLQGTITDFVGENAGPLGGTLRIRRTRADAGPTADTRVGGYITYDTAIGGRLELPWIGERREVQARVFGAFRGGRGKYIIGNVFPRSGGPDLEGAFIAER